MTTKQKLDEFFTINYNRLLIVAKNIRYGSRYKFEPSDVVQECIAEIYSLSPEKQEDIVSYILAYSIQIIKFSYNSTTSKYHKKYADPRVEYTSNRLPETIEEDYVFSDYDHLAQREFINILNKKCDWYEREVFMRYVLGDKSFAQFSKETKIPVSSLYNTYKKTLNILREEVKMLKIAAN